MVVWTLIVVVGGVTAFFAVELLIHMFKQEADNGDDL